MAENRLGVGKISLPFGMDNNLKIALEDFIARVSDTTDYLMKPQVKSVSSNYQASDLDSVILCDATSGSKTVTMPNATVMSGKHITVKKVDSSANAVIVSGSIDGAASYSLSTQNKYVSIVSDGTSWHIISNN